MVAYLYKILMENKPDGVLVYADIEGAKVNGGTIPPDMVVTIQRPYLVIIDKNHIPTSVFLVELTIPFTRNIEASNARKTTRYDFLSTDIEAAGYTLGRVMNDVCASLLQVLITC